jgi:hypothetical protein
MATNSFDLQRENYPGYWFENSNWFKNSKPISAITDWLPAISYLQRVPH